MAHRLGVCSWSLRPTDPDDLVRQARQCGLSCVQLALDPIRRGEWTIERTRRALDAGEIRVLSGMMAMAGEDYTTLETIARTGGVRPDATWTSNLEAARENGEIAHALSLDLVTFHAGVIPEGRTDPERGIILDRLNQLLDVFADAGIRIAFETGQESAPVMLAALEELRHEPGVNFDPANMILYGTGDPIEAFEMLLPRVLQVHVKDALWTDQPGTWGREVVAGSGAVDFDRLCGLIDEHLPNLDLVIEREWGESRVEDVRRARDLIVSRLAIEGMHA